MHTTKGTGLKLVPTIRLPIIGERERARLARGIVIALPPLYIEMLVVVVAMTWVDLLVAPQLIGRFLFQAGQLSVRL